jgi:hypothetical protein
MQIVLFTLLGVVVFVVLLVLLAIYFFKRKMGKYIEMAKKSGGGGHVTPRIHLSASAEPLQLQPALNFISQFDAMGYTSIGTYDVPEMIDTRIFAMHHAGHNLAAAVCEAQNNLAWFDVTAIGVKATNTLFASSSPVFNRENHAPTLRIHHDLHLSPMAAQQWLLENRGDGPWRTLDAAHFAHEFERAYARSLDFQLARGGPDVEMVKKWLTQLNDKNNYSEQDLKNAVEMQGHAYRYALTEACQDNFLEISSLPAREWERMRDDVLVVHERLPLDEAAHLAGNQADDDFDVDTIDFAAAGITTPQQAFMHVVTQQNLTRRLKYLGAVTEPVAAKLYYFDQAPH